jgi:hypothetical protein
MVDKIGDPFLNYFALGLLIFVVIAIFYGIIAIHDIPAKIAKGRHHPHEDAIHAAGWVSLFMLHVLWPFLWIWAMAYQPERGWGFSGARAEPHTNGPPVNPSAIEDLRRRIAELEKSGSRVAGASARPPIDTCGTGDRQSRVTEPENERTSAGG